MATPTQQELEQPVKGYQLEAVAKEVSDLRKFTENGFKEVGNKLDTVLGNTKGLASCIYVEDRLEETKTEILSTVDLKYGKQSKGIEKLKWIIFAGVIGISFQIITYFILNVGD